MAEQKIDIKIQINKDASVSIKSLSKEFGNIKVSAKDASMAAKQLGVDIQKIKAGGNVSVVAKDFTKLRDAMSGASAASGGATASVLELGRVISDAPYGIRGVANNLQQLASNFAFMAKQAGGAGAAMKAIGSALMGPLGILIAVQTVIAVLDHFSGKMGEVKNELGELEAQGVTANVMKLHLLREALNDSTVAMEDKVSALKEAGTEFSELNGFIDDGTIALDAFNEKVGTMIMRMREVAFAKAVLKETEEVMQDFVKTVVKGADVTITDRFLGIFNPVASGQTLASARFAKEVSEIEGKYTKLYDLLLMKQKDGDGILLEHIFGDSKKSGSGTRARILKQNLLDLSKLIQSNYEKTWKSSEKNEIELMKLNEDFERQDLARRKQAFIDRQVQRHKDFVAKAKTQEEINQADEVLRKSKLQAESQYQEALTSLEVKHTMLRYQKQLELQQKFDEEMFNQQLISARANESRLQSLRAGTGAGALNKPMSAVGAEDIEGQNEMARQRMAAEQENFENDLERKKTNLLNEGFSLLEVEQMVAGERHAFQMSQAEQEIELERNKIEAKRNINQEYVSWVQGLSSVFKSIAGENEALATAALVLEKGSAIANVVISTQAANAKITANMLEEQAGYRASAGLYSAVPVVAAGFEAQAVMAGVMGKKRILKNNIGAGISIAKIAATTLQSRGGASGGGGGGGEGGGGGRTFDFNLVGSTGQDQLAQAVGGQFSQGPVQAYVVSSQMTSQQQLDNIIESDATFGGDN
jgi:hypothetical protein